MPETLGTRLRGARLEKGWSMYELSERSGLTQASISLYENGKQIPTLYSASCICDALGVSLDWLAGIERPTTIEADPVVRCKECVRRYNASLCPMYFLIDDEDEDYTFDDGFCDRGERRDDNG